MAAPAEILLITSKDEPRGIADDAYLKSALSPGLAAWRWCDWDDVPPTPPPTASFWIRSLWEGRDAQGATPRLRTFLASLAAAAPQLAADYELILWIVHKRYLLELGRGGTVPTVPTVLTSELVERAGARPEGGEGGGGAVAVSPGAIKRAMVSRGWADAVLKPAVGTRCEGVLRLSTRGDEWTLGTAMEVAKLLRESQGDCLLQPFLPPCRRPDAPLPPPRAPPSRPDASGSDGSSGQAIVHWGEVCVLFLDGKVIHAVHKEPNKWGWHRDTCPCSNRGDALAGAECSCDSLGGAGAAHSVTIGTSSVAAADAAAESADAAAESADAAAAAVDSASQAHDDADIAPVQVLELPLPPAIGKPAMAAAAALPRSNELMLFRVDLLPRRREEGAQGGAEAEAGQEGIEWLVSEVEGQWCQMFLRAAAAAASPEVAESIVASVVARQTGGGQGRQVKRRRLSGVANSELGVSWT